MVSQRGMDWDRRCEREKCVKHVMNLFFALRHIKGKPTLKDLVKLAKRMRKDGRV